MFDRVPSAQNVLSGIDTDQLPESIRQVLDGTTPHLQGAQLDFESGRLIPPSYPN